TTNLRTVDQGNIINYQRKTLIATSKPILEYSDDYTPDGIDNEKWTGIHDGASLQRHKAWRASYTLQVGQVVDGETYEVVFYAQKPNPMVIDLHNENAVYLYEDLTKAYLAVWKGDTADNLSVSTDLTLMGIVAVPATQVPDFLKLGILNLITTADPFMGYYQGSFLVDILGNGDTQGYVPQITLPDIGDIIGGINANNTGQAINGLSSAITTASSNSSSLSYSVPSYFVRHLVADTRGPVTKLDIPQGVKATDQAATVSATIVDDGSGIANAKLIINGKVVAEKNGPISNVTLDYTFGKGESVGANEIKVVVVDQAGNETVTRGSFGVQEMNAPVIADEVGPSGENVKTAYPTITAAYSDETGIDLSSVVLTLNGAVLTDATVTPSKVSYTPTSPLKAGVVYTVKLSLKDTTGVASEKTWTFKLEGDAPSVTDVTPPSAAVDKTGMPVISAKFNDGDGTGINKDSVKLTIDKVTVDALVTDKSVSYKPATVMSKGKHTAELTVADVAGNVKVQSWEFSIEEDAPVITDVLPAGDINTDMPVLSAKFSDAGVGIDLKSVTMTLNGEIVSATVGEGNVSFAVTEPLKPNVGYVVGIRVADKAGNVASASSNFKLETTKPVISGMLPTGTVNSIDVAVSANYSDTGAGIDIKSALMKVDGVVVPANASASGIAYRAQKLTRGDHTVYVEVADRFGNVFSQSWTFKVEETPPVISSVEPKDGEKINTATPVLKATYSDAGTGIDVNSVVMTLNGKIVPATVSASQASYQVLEALEKNVTYKVTVQVADMAGNIQSASSSFSLETTPPTISATAPTGTVSDTDAAKGVAISATLADDGSGVNPESVKMWVDGSPVMVTATDKSANYIAKGLGYGEHSVRLVVADMLGNVADKTWKFSVGDTTKPTVSVLSPKENQTVGVKPIIRISYADEGSGVDLTSISVKIDDKPVSAGAMAPAKPGDAKVVSAGESSYEVKLAFGWHTLSVSVKDVAGNEGTAEVKFMVEGDVLDIVKAHNYPNPFKGDTTKITFGLSKKSKVSIRVYDFTNTLVATVAEDEEREASEKVEFSWDGTTDAAGGRQLATGVYFCQIITKTDSETKSQIIKIALVRE
ncbi:MAG: Ig-like domain-containing protein, partial [Candidatus Poribacteria bacterium]